MVEAEVGGFCSFVARMSLCAKPECCDDLVGFPLDRRAWNSVTIKQDLDATGGFEILAGTGCPGASRPCFPPGGSAGWAGHECAKLGSHEVVERSRCDPKAASGFPPRSLCSCPSECHTRPPRNAPTSTSDVVYNGRTAPLRAALGLGEMICTRAVVS